MPPSFELERVLAQDDWIRRLARRLVRDPHAADDLAQDAWVAALESGCEAAAPRRWLAGVLRNARRRRFDYPRAMLAAAALALLVLGSPQDAWSREEMAADLAQLGAAVRAQWAYLDDRREHFGLDLDALLAGKLAALDGVRSRADFADVLRELVAELQDGHGNVAIECGEPPRRYLLLELADCAEGAVVVSADADSALGPEARGPQRGDLLTAIDGRPLEELLDERGRTACASTPGQRRARAFEELVTTRAEEALVELVDAAGERHRVRLRTRAWPLVEEPDNWALSWPAEHVALLRVESFAVKDWKAWLEAAPDEREPFLRATYERLAEIFGELAAKGAQALILDLRGNGGGTDALGIRLALHLLPKPFVYFRLSALGENGWHRPGGITYRAEPGMAVFPGRLVALTDEGCFSTTDNFLRCLRDLHPRFTAVGRPTGGGTGAPRTIAKLAHSGAAVTLCTMRVYGPKSGLIEGRGTTPDVPVTWTRADVLAGRDPDLEAALRLLDE